MKEASIDLRSDTITRPTPPMLEAMMQAKVGDDVFAEDPSINELQQKVADMFGMEDALFCPSGSMTNQIAIRLHTTPGDEVICDQLAHIYLFEGGGIASNSGASVRLLQGDMGRFTASQVEENINRDDPHFPRTRLVAVENTMNRGGGAIWKFSELENISALCKKHKLAFHMDGARLFNALVETKETPAAYGKIFDTISICLSKGLGAPVGSLLIGSREHIYKARRIRKVFGGGMRQAGFLAAAGLYALDNHVERLKIDHARARETGELLQNSSFVKEVLPVESNIVIFRVNNIAVGSLLEKLAKQNIRAVSIGRDMVRFVFHLDIDQQMHERLLSTLKTLN